MQGRHRILPGDEVAWRGFRCCGCIAAEVLTTQCLVQVIYCVGGHSGALKQRGSVVSVGDLDTAPQLAHVQLFERGVGDDVVLVPMAADASGSSLIRRAGVGGDEPCLPESATVCGLAADEDGLVQLFSSCSRTGRWR